MSDSDKVLVAVFLPRDIDTALSVAAQRMNLTKSDIAVMLIEDGIKYGPLFND